MKKTELLQIIREETEKVLNEEVAPLNVVAAGMIVNLINQKNLPKETFQFIWSHQAENVAKKSSPLKDAVTVIKNKFDDKFLMAPASKELMAKLTPYVKKKNLSVKDFNNVGKFFTVKTTQLALRNDAYLSVLETFLSTSNDMTEVADFLSKEYPSLYGTLIQATWNNAKKLKARAKAEGGKAIESLLEYAKLGKVKVLSDAKIRSRLSSFQREDNKGSMSKVDSRSFQYVRHYIA